MALWSILQTYFILVYFILVYCTAIWYILWLLGIFGIFFPFWYVVPENSGNPDWERLQKYFANEAPLS
jgi:hypothetical protein